MSKLKTYIAAAEQEPAAEPRLLDKLAAMPAATQLAGCFHYGLQIDRESSFSRCQQAWQGLVAASLESEAPARVLLRGPSAGSLGEYLRQAKPGLGSALLQAQAELGSGSTAAGKSGNDSPDPFDLIVVEGSYRFLDQLDILQTARQQLAPEGQLLVLGEFIDDDSEIRRSCLSNLSALRQLAERLGLQINKEEELSAAVTGGIATLSRQLEQSGPESSGLVKTLGSLSDEFRSGRRCYRLFSISLASRVDSPFPDARFLVGGQFAHEELADLFKASFETEFDRELWRWKYDLGGGRCIAVRPTAEGEIVAHYGGAPRLIHYFGKPGKAIQVGDVMVLPSVRKHYGKRSLFFQAAATFLEREIGNTVSHLLGFGFPNQKAMNIALRLGLYEKTDEFKELILPEVVPSGGVPAEAEWQLVEVEAQAMESSGLADRLWAQMAPDFADGIIGVRDDDYLNYRYRQHPAADRGRYRFFTVNGADGGALALLVLREHAGSLLLLDCISVLAQMPAVLYFAAAKLAGRESLPVKLWLTKAWIDRLDLTNCTEQELKIEIPCNAWNPGPAAKDLRGKWWLTAGDMDFM